MGCLYRKGIATQVTPTSCFFWKRKKARETLKKNKGFPEGPARHLDASLQKLTPHCPAAIFHSQPPSPNCLLKCLQNCLSPTREDFFACVKIAPAVWVIARQLSGKNCLAAMFAARQCLPLWALWAFSSRNTKNPWKEGTNAQTRKEHRKNETSNEIESWCFQAFFVPLKGFTSVASQGEEYENTRAFLNLWFAKPMVCKRIASHENDESRKRRK